MNFVMTKFAYPLKEKMLLYDGVYFDNPRTTQEIKYISGLIRKSTPFPPNDRLAGGEGFITVEYVVNKIKEKYGEDEYVQDVICNSKYKDACYKLASMWVILRVNEKKNLDDYFESIETIHGKIDTLTLLAFEDHHYIDFSVLLTSDYYSLYEEEIVDKIQSSILEILVEATNRKNIEGRNYRFNGFKQFYKEIITINEKIEKLKNKELIEYVMKNIQLLRGNRDLKMKFVSIISIIELLLTHSPDFSRFNVEESINKQFKHKLALCCYLKDKTCDYDLIIKECGLFYTLRSDAAHGNFQTFPSNLKKYFDFCKKNDYTHVSEFDTVSALNILIKRSLKYMTIILNSYLEDYKLIEIMKKM